MTISEKANRPGDEQEVTPRRPGCRRRSGGWTRRTAVVAAAALAGPFGLFGVGAASATMARPHPIDDRRPGGYAGGYGGYPPYGGWWSDPDASPYAGPSDGSPSGVHGTGSETTRVATAAESTGLVEIASTLEFGRGEAAGTGMLIGSNGLVVTNHHVIADSTKLVATVVSTGKSYPVRVLGYDATQDVALVRLRGASGLATVSASTAKVRGGA